MEEQMSEEGPQAEYLRTLRAAMDVAMDPLDLGRAVVRGIRENARYIFTHREFLDEVCAMHRQIEDAFPKDQAIPEPRRAFEMTRRHIAEHLHALPTKD
jgi:hypothetical protein